MKRYKVLVASLMLGAGIGVAGTLVVVHTSTIDVAAQTVLPKPSECSSVLVSDLETDPRYESDTALIAALSVLPDNLQFYRCVSSR